VYGYVGKPFKLSFGTTGHITGTDEEIRLVLTVLHNSIHNPSLHDSHFAY